MERYRETIIILVMIGILMFAVQLLFCFKAKRIVFKLIPAYIVLFFVLFATALYAGVFGIGSFNAHQILAKILAIGICPAVIGMAISWIIYGTRIR